MKGIGTLSIFLILWLLFLLFLIIGWIALQLIKFYPSGSLAYSITHTLFGAIITFFDNSFIFIALFLLSIDALISYLYPNILQGILNIFLFFILFFVFLNVSTFTYTLNNAFSANVIMPNTSAFFTNNYLLYILLAFNVLTIIFNFRKPN